MEKKKDRFKMDAREMSDIRIPQCTKCGFNNTPDPSNCDIYKEGKPISVVTNTIVCPAFMPRGEKK